MPRTGGSENKTPIPVAISLDAGGTMTDSFILFSDGSFRLGKALTNPPDESVSFINSIADAFGDPNFRLDSIKGIIYSGTLLLNAILTRSGVKTALFVTRGFRDLLTMLRGLSWLGYSYEDRVHQVTHMVPPPLVDPAMVKEIPERINSSGQVVIPLDEDAVAKSVEEAIAQGAMAIAIVFLHSTINPAHEQRARKIAEEVIARKGLKIPVVISSEVGRGGEVGRAVATVVQAGIAEKSRAQYLKIWNDSRARGYRGRLYTVLSYGSLVDSTTYTRLYETMISGPIGGLMGAKYIGELLGESNVVATDLGGTSFDMGVIRNGIIQIRREADFARYPINLPMVAMDSILAGAGVVVRADLHSKRVTLASQSAGYRVGVSFNYPELTITDCAVSLGYLNPDYFLGGKVKLNRSAALNAIKERLAEPLGLDTYDAASMAIEVLRNRMRDGLNATLRARGYVPTEFVVMSYGGAGPLFMWTFDDLPFKDYVTFPFAAVFSAFGNLTSDYAIRWHRMLNVSIPSNPSEEDVRKAGDVVNRIFEELENSLMNELRAQGFRDESVEFKHLVYMRFIGQLEDHEVVSPVPRLRNLSDYNALYSAFEDYYTKLYPRAALNPEAGIAINELAVIASVSREFPKPVLPEHPLERETPSSDAFKGQREVYYEGKWIKFDVWEMDRLGAGNVVKGPAVLEHPMTTLIIPPDRQATFDKYRIIHYKHMR